MQILGVSKSKWGRFLPATANTPTTLLSGSGEAPGHRQVDHFDGEGADIGARARHPSASVTGGVPFRERRDRVGQIGDFDMRALPRVNRDRGAS
jgi:hypothetical protein